MGKSLTIIGVVLLLMGALWALQGIGLVGGSFMTGQRHWLVIGIITAVIGLAMVFWGRARAP